MSIKKVPVKQLRFGMYLARSARNNAGELILPEGIYINRKQQISRLLSNYIEYVEIDMSRSLSKIEIAEPEPEQKAEVKKEPETPDEMISSLKEELITAEKTYMESQYVLSNIIDSLRYGKQPDEAAFDAVVDEIIGSIERNSHALQSLATLRAQDEHSFQHSVNVCINTLIIAKNIFKKHEVLISVGKGALLHDIGKTRLSPHILKKSYALNAQEMELYKRHPQLGISICNEQGIQDNIVREIVLHHHEAFDGSGYPDKLQARQINRYANLVSIADYYDEITSEGTMYKRVSPPAAIRMISRMSGKHFDPRIVNLFISNIGIYPIGSFILFESGKIGIVTTFLKDEITNPVMKILTDENQQPVEYPETATLKTMNEKVVDYNIRYNLDFSLHTIL